MVKCACEPYCFSASQLSLFLFFPRGKPPTRACDLSEWSGKNLVGAYCLSGSIPLPSTASFKQLQPIVEERQNEILALGKNTSLDEIQDVSKDGIWMIHADREYFLPFAEFPWFKKATISMIYNVETHHGTHLYWPDLDVDLELNSLQNPNQYPLVYH